MIYNKKVCKRMFAFMLAVLMMVQSAWTGSMTVYAQENDGQQSVTEQNSGEDVSQSTEVRDVAEENQDDERIAADEEAAAVTYTIDDDGKMVVRGTGEIADGTGKVLWESRVSDVVTAEIHLADTVDASNMFKNCENLKSVNLSDFKVTKVRKMNSMFENCKELKEINMSTFNLNVLEQAKDFMKGCEKLETIYAPRGLTVEIDLPALSNIYREYWYVVGEEDTAITKLPLEATSTVVVKKGARKENVTITGIVCDDKTFDGKAIVYDASSVVVTRESDQSNVLESKTISFTYTFTGKLADGTKVEATTEKPSKAGDYVLTVAVSEEEDEYTGKVEIPFKINPAKVTVSANDFVVEQGDELPDSYTYDVTGFLFNERLEKAPTLTCSVTDSSVIGDYPIVPSDAYAGNNYAIIYKNGTLSIIDPVMDNLVEIDKIDGVTAKNGTPLNDIKLPAMVAIKTESNKTYGANILWDKSKFLYETTYDPALKTAQTFILGGVVVLPNKVSRNGHDLNVEITVTVYEDIVPGAAAGLPYPDIKDGSQLKKGTAVALLCDTLGATIYYTVDGTTPTSESTVYTTPIIIDHYTVIRAFATKAGYENSEIVRYSYSVETEKPGEDDPDDGDDSDDDSDDAEEKGVAEEDIPENGKIPNGIWVSKIPDQEYTGQPVKPVFRVYDHKVRLKENVDYTIQYKNNVNVNSTGAVDKAAKITITGKGNYEGSYFTTFTIVPKSLSDEDVYADDIALQYNKKKPCVVNPVVLWNGKTLAKKKDFVVSVEELTKRGEYVVNLYGVGNYTGEKQIKVVVTDGVLASTLSISKVDKQTYTGKEIKPNVVVMNKKERLQQDLHYTVRYENNIEVGTAYIVITGTGRVTGVRRIPFEIQPIVTFKQSNVIINMEFENQAVYTGKAVRPTSYTVKATGYDARGQKCLKTLVEHEDYEVSFENDNKAGKAAIVVKGIHNYAGTVKQTYKIDKYDITKNEDNRFQVKMQSSYSFRKGGCNPEPEITFAGKTLKRGVDYMLSYRNTARICDNLQAKNVPTVIITGKGNFSGKITKSYTISARDIAGLTLRAADKVWSNRKNNFKTNVGVIDVNGATLENEKDFLIKLTYAYEETGEEIPNGTIVPVGTLIRVTATVTKEKNYNGSVSGTYRMVAGDIARATVKIPAQYFTGKTIEPRADIAVYMNGKLVDTSDYEIVEFKNNLNKGTATVVLRGKNNLGGTKIAKFTIKRKKFS